MTTSSADAGCRTCYEVACNPKTITDRYGEVLDRQNACYDTSKTIVVKVIDRYVKGLLRSEDIERSLIVCSSM